MKLINAPRIKVVLLAIVGYLALSSSVYAGDFEPFDIGTADASGQILVVMEKTEFKLGVLQGLADGFSGESVHFRVEPFQSYPTVNEADWDVIIVMAPVYSDDVPKPTRDYLESLSTRSKAILLATSGNDNVSIQVDGVDALSSSSLKLQRIEPSVDRISSFIRARL